ncbi:hypothetical protein TNCV_749691 [Trichonephila clavipes]|nr:hypothetical protein TNCV_749691 [Trichonephila clavipes]
MSSTRNRRRDHKCPAARHRMVREHMRAPSESAICAWMAADGAVSCTRSDENIRLSKVDCKESEESADLIDNIPLKPDIYVAKDDKECIPHNSNVPGRFATKQQSSKLHET